MRNSFPISSAASPTSTSSTSTPKSFDISITNSANMESEERPSKIRKIGTDADEALVTETAPSAVMQNDLQKKAAEVPSEVSGMQDAAPEEHTGKIGQDEELPVPDAVAPLASASTNGDQQDPPLSKSQQKKLKRKAEWEAKREDRKVERKVKLQAKRERKRDERQQLIEQGVPLPTPTKAIYKRATQLPVTILIDCNFDELMHDGERTSLGSQITRSYSDNKNSQFRAHLTICSFGGKLKERFDTVMASQYKLWKGVRTFETGFVETAEKAKNWMSSEKGGELGGVFAKYAVLDEEATRKLKAEGEIVYLSSEASEDLWELKPYSTYIIGGLVDKNREKGICHRRATKAGIRTAKLPIGEYMDMASRKVLATNHVNEILMRWLECGDWGEAFFKVMPKRKGGTLKTARGADENGEEDGPADNGADENEPNNGEGGVSLSQHTPADGEADRGSEPIEQREEPTAEVAIAGKLRPS